MGLLQHRILRVSRRAGIGMALLPVLYQTSGVGGLPPNQGQRHFIRSADSTLRLLNQLKLQCDAQDARLGLALHFRRMLEAVLAFALERGTAEMANVT